MTLPFLIFNPMKMMGQESEPRVDFEEVDYILSQIPDICSSEPELILGTSNSVENLSSYSLSYPITGITIKVNGELIVDEFAHFIDCDFIMDAGALITLRENEVLDITGSHLQTCVDTFWQGINMEKNSLVLLKASVFKDSYFGVHSSNQSVAVEVVDNVFDNNYHCIYIGDENYEGPYSTVLMAGNILAQTDLPLKKSWQGGPFITEYYTEAVITRNARVFANASFDPESDRNIVYQYYSGYRFLNSFAIVKSNLMKDFREFISEEFRENGWGINSQGRQGQNGFLLQEAWVNDQNYSFENVFDAILANDSDLSISNNLVTGAYRSILIHRANITNVIDIENNVLESSRQGIQIQEMPAKYFRLKYNHISVDFDLYYTSGPSLFPFGLSSNSQVYQITG